MALKLEAHYPNRFDSPSTEYPQGKWRNRSDSTANDGGYLEQDWLNDEYGFRGALLINGGVTPDGTIDTAKKSQVYEALINVIIANQQDTSGFLLKANLSSTTGQRTDTAMTQKAVTDALDGKRGTSDLVFTGSVARFTGTDNDSVRFQTVNGGGDGIIFTYNASRVGGFYNTAGGFSVGLPRKTGTLALTSDIPSLSGYATQSWVNSNSSKLGSLQSVVGKSGSGLSVGARTLNALNAVPPNSVVTRAESAGGANPETRVYYRPITRI